ncbi:hypothetical protein O3M35_011161 [Rhynocoris fuscipes]|uniref:Uncharacterized protein n=1 Tax=Rhynocoris fuscipes TaxID=488301 RepID=A0AAW1CXV5_9HEMI
MMTRQKILYLNRCTRKSCVGHIRFFLFLFFNQQNEEPKSNHYLIQSLITRILNSIMIIISQ